ncbi:MAG: cell division protein FtsQ/DivIB [Pseudomonadota bacterium]
MRSLIRDPAPSRSAYRLHRLWLTPRFWFALKYVVPTVLVSALLGVWLADEMRRDTLLQRAADLRRQIEERPEFMVRLVAVDGATPEVADKVRTAIGLNLPSSSFDLNLVRIKEAAEGLDAVRRAEVRIRSGGVLQIDVSQREPALVWRMREGLVLLDATGHPVVPVAARRDRPDLPLIAGPGANRAAPEAIALLAVARPIEDRIRGLVRVGERRWDVVLKEDRRIMLPETDPVPALERIIALDQADDVLARDLTVVDMRLPSRPTLRLAPLPPAQDPPE